MKYYKKLLKLIRVLKEKQTGYVEFSHSRPLYSSEYHLKSDKVKMNKKIGIVIQGPLVKESDFTLETIKIYKKTFSQETHLIVSTWKGEDQETVKKIRATGAIVLENDPPHQPGIKNINFQIVSSGEGIRKAKERGVEYVLKTRTDQRMYAPNVEEFLCTMIDLFPVAEEYAQEKRIVAVSLNTYKYRPYSISDMMLFGTLHDMENYFSLPEDTRLTPNFHNIQSWSQERLCEVYLSTNFLEKVGRKLTFTLEDSWSAYANNFCIVDTQSLDLFWYKYEYWKEYQDLTYKEMKNNQELTFREWVILHRSLNNKAGVPEKIIEGQFGKVITV
jgi:hypothetical protein